MTGAGRPAPAPVERPGAVEWLTVALICGSAALCGLLELLFVGRFYAGSVIVPVVIAFAVVTNVVLPAWGFRVLGRAQGAVLPLLAWLVMVLGLTLYTRPEGDLIVIDAYGQQWGFYGVLLLGAGAGFGVIVVLAGRLSPRTAAASRPTPSPAKPTTTTPAAPRQPARRKSTGNPARKKGGGGVSR